MMQSGQINQKEILSRRLHYVLSPLLICQIQKGASFQARHGLLRNLSLPTYLQPCHHWDYIEASYICLHKPGVCTKYCSPQQCVLLSTVTWTEFNKKIKTAKRDKFFMPKKVWQAAIVCNSYILLKVELSNVVSR